MSSVAAQTLDAWQHVVVDDGSRDESLSRIRTVAATDSRYLVIAQHNQGVAAARNAGYAAAAASDYVLFLDADDALEPDMLELTVSYLDAHPEVGLVHCQPQRIDADGASLPEPQRWPPRYAPGRVGARILRDDEARTPFESIFALAGIVPSVAVIRRAVYDRTPGWDVSFGQPCEDTHLFLYVALLSEVHFIPPRLARYRDHPRQSTANAALLAAQERRLEDRWAVTSVLPLEHRTIVEAAWRFRYRRLIPHDARRAAGRALRRGRPDMALRHAVGAARLVLSTRRRAPSRARIDRP